MHGKGNISFLISLVALMLSLMASADIDNENKQSAEKKPLLIPSYSGDFYRGVIKRDQESVERRETFLESLKRRFNMRAASRNKNKNKNRPLIKRTDEYEKGDESDLDWYEIYKRDYTDSNDVEENGDGIFKRYRFRIKRPFSAMTPYQRWQEKLKTVRTEKRGPFDSDEQDQYGETFQFPVKRPHSGKTAHQRWQEKLKAARAEKRSQFDSDEEYENDDVFEESKRHRMQFKRPYLSTAPRQRWLEKLKASRREN